MKRYLLTTLEQCLTFIKNLPSGEKLHSVKAYPGGYEVLVETEEKIRTEITVTAKNFNVMRISEGMHSGLSGYPYSI
jgi:hypothetical protein